MKKKLFVWFLAAALLCALLPASALAATACTFAFTTDALADGAVGFPYSAKIEWESTHFDGSGPCDVGFFLDQNSGPLPDGLTLSEDGTISGTPTKAGEFTFLVNAIPKEGTEHSNFSGDEKEFTITVHDTVSVEIPFTKIVRQGGDTAPGAETFQFELYEFGASGDYKVTGNTVATNGAGTYGGRIVIEVSEAELGNLSEGFWVREVNGGKADWSYAPETWFVRVILEDTGMMGIAISKDGPETSLSYEIADGTVTPTQNFNPIPYEPETVREITFTNVYTNNEVYYNPTPTPTPAPEPDLPQTGDHGMVACGIALLLLAAAAGMATLCAKKH